VPPQDRSREYRGLNHAAMARAPCKSVLEDNRRRRAEFLRRTEAAEPFLHSGTPPAAGGRGLSEEVLCESFDPAVQAPTKDCRAGAQGIEALQRTPKQMQAADVVHARTALQGGDSLCRVSDQGVASALPSHMRAWNKQVRARLDQVVEATL
jgi:hypothetical protein